MIYTYTSSKTIISKVFRDLKIQRNDWIYDGIEWIGEALEAINAAPQLEDKARVLQVQSHKSALPSDLHRIREVRYGIGTDGGYEDLTLTNGQNAVLSNQTSFKLSDIEGITRSDFSLVLKYGDSSNHPSLVDEDRNVDKGANHTQESFILNPGYIQTSFEEDWILITYLGFALDEDDFPMVPDNYSYKQALYWYIVWKLIEGGQEHPAGIGWGDARKEWLRYCTQARNQANMPDESKYEQFFESWVTMVPHLNYRTEGDEFKYTSYEEDDMKYENFFVDLD